MLNSIELSLVSLKSSPSGGAITSVIATTLAPKSPIFRVFSTLHSCYHRWRHGGGVVIIGLHAYDTPHRPRLTCTLLLPAKADTRGRDRNGPLRAGGQIAQRARLVPGFQSVAHCGA